MKLLNSAKVSSNKPRAFHKTLHAILKFYAADDNHHHRAKNPQETKAAALFPLPQGNTIKFQLRI